MKLGTKEYYKDLFQHVLMTNFIASKSQSLSSTQSYYVDQIRSTATITEGEKKLYLSNLKKSI